MKKKVVILGGGITALASAYYLEKAGFHDYVILERHGAVGGLCRSIMRDGFTFDYTGHVLWRMDPETLKFYEDLLGDNLGWRERKAAVWTHDSLVPYPFQSHLKNLPDEIKYECLSGFLNRGRYLKGVDFESWSLSMFGDGIHKHFMVPFNEKLFGVPMREMTNEWCADVPVPTVDQILRGAILGETFQQKGNAKFAYPKVGGMQSLVDAAVSRIPKENIMTGRDVCEVNVEKKTVTHRDWSGNKNEISYEYLISTITLQKLLMITRPQDGALTKTAINLKSNSVACVMLGFARRITDMHWLYAPESKYSFYRLTFPSNSSDNMTPHGMSSVMAEITIPKGASLSSDDFVRSTLAGMRDMRLIGDEGSNPVETMHVEYIAPAYVIFDLYRSKTVPQYLEGLSKMGVWSTGRYGSWGYTSVSENIAQGRTAVKSYLRGLSC